MEGPLEVSESRSDLKPTLPSFDTAGFNQDDPAGDIHHGGFDTMYATTARRTSDIVLYVVMSQEMLRFRVLQA